MELWQRTVDRHPRFVRARCERALWLAGTGRWTPERSVEEAAVAAAAEPLNAWVAGMAASVLCFAGRHAEAIAEAERGVGIDAESFLARVALLQAHAWAGHDAQAIQMGPSLLATSGRHVWVLGTLAWVHARSGKTAHALAVFDELEARSRHEFVPPSWLAISAAAAGLDDAATTYGRRIVEERDPLTMIARLLPQFDRVRTLSGIDRLLADATA